MKPQLLQNLVWLAFLVSYFAYKYLVGLQSWNTAYAIQVAIIVILTAILPYYLTRFTINRLDFNPAIGATLIMPTLFAVLGYGVFYFVFIMNNFPEVTASQVMPRGVLPGACITAILGGGLLWKRTQGESA